MSKISIGKVSLLDRGSIECISENNSEESLSSDLKTLSRNDSNEAKKMDPIPIITEEKKQPLTTYSESLSIVSLGRDRNTFTPTSTCHLLS